MCFILHHVTFGHSRPASRKVSVLMLKDWGWLIPFRKTHAARCYSSLGETGQLVKEEWRDEVTSQRQALTPQILTCASRSSGPLYICFSFGTIREREGHAFIQAHIHLDLERSPFGRRDMVTGYLEYARVPSRIKTHTCYPMVVG